MKLYRGIKGDTFMSNFSGVEKQYLVAWKKILTLRAKGSLRYPEKLSSDIAWLHKANKMTYQHFTDRKDVAYRYAISHKGRVVEIDVPLSDILKYFFLEFQNYPKRHALFEVVYIVSMGKLEEMAKRWKLKVIQG